MQLVWVLPPPALSLPWSVPSCALEPGPEEARDGRRARRLCVSRIGSWQTLSGAIRSSRPCPPTFISVVAWVAGKAQRRPTCTHTPTGTPSANPCLSLLLPVPIPEPIPPTLPLPLPPPRPTLPLHRPSLPSIQPTSIQRRTWSGADDSSHSPQIRSTPSMKADSV